jgi:hypothetical protein
MKYKDLIKNLPYDLQDRILDVVFKEHKNIIKNVIKPSNNEEIYNKNINKVINEFSYYNIPLNIRCCFYSDLYDVVYKFKNNEEKKLYIPYKDIFFYVFHQEYPPDDLMENLLIFDYTLFEDEITNWDLINCYMKSFKDLFQEYADLLHIPMSKIRFNFKDYLNVKKIYIYIYDSKPIIKGIIDI